MARLTLLYFRFERDLRVFSKASPAMRSKAVSIESNARWPLRNVSPLCLASDNQPRSLSSPASAGGHFQSTCTFGTQKLLTEGYNTELRVKFPCPDTETLGVIPGYRHLREFPAPRGHVLHLLSQFRTVAPLKFREKGVAPLHFRFCLALLTGRHLTLEAPHLGRRPKLDALGAFGSRFFRAAGKAELAVRIPKNQNWFEAGRVGGSRGFMPTTGKAPWPIARTDFLIAVRANTHPLLRLPGFGPTLPRSRPGFLPVRRGCTASACASRSRAASG